MKQMRGPRISAQFWLDIAIDNLCEHGPDALTIEALCRKANRTKGSFYAHFHNYEAFLLALVALWRTRNTEAVIQGADEMATPQDRLAVLNHLVLRLDPRLGERMRELADRYPFIAAAIIAVDEERVAYLAGLYMAADTMSDSDARDLATIEYATYVGLLRMGPPRDLAEMERLYQAFLRLTGREPRPPGDIPPSLRGNDVDRTGWSGQNCC
jgi:AcrR family transcriptional regulator